MTNEEYNQILRELETMKNNDNFNTILKIVDMAIKLNTAQLRFVYNTTKGVLGEKV